MSCHTPTRSWAQSLVYLSLSYTLSPSTWHHLLRLLLDQSLPCPYRRRPWIVLKKQHATLLCLPTCKADASTLNSPCHAACNKGATTQSSPLDCKHASTDLMARMTPFALVWLACNNSCNLAPRTRFHPSSSASKTMNHRSAPTPPSTKRFVKPPPPSTKKTSPRCTRPSSKPFLFRSPGRDLSLSTPISPPPHTLINPSAHTPIDRLRLPAIKSSSHPGRTRSCLLN
jgi:hypothetical protein